MPTYFRIPLDAIPEDQRVGPVDPADIASSISVNAKGVEKRRPFPATTTTYSRQLVDVAPERHLDALTVCQIALFRLLATLVMHRKNLEAFLNSGDLQTDSFTMNRVIIDWPRNEEDLKPMPISAIVPAGEILYVYPGFDTMLVEESIDAHGPGTVLRKMSNATMTLTVHMLFPHKEERRAAHSAIEREFLAEPDDDQPDRHVVVPEYFDQTARLRLRGVTRPDGSEGAKTNEWELQARFECDVDVVKLVTTPTRIQQPVNGVQVGTSVVPAGS